MHIKAPDKVYKEIKDLIIEMFDIYLIYFTSRKLMVPKLLNNIECSYAGLHCVVIKGYSKSAGYQPGVCFEDNRFRNSWNAVYVAGAWRFVQCNWGARHLVNAKEVPRPGQAKAKNDSLRYDTAKSAGIVIVAFACANKTIDEITRTFHLGTNTTIITS